LSRLSLQTVSGLYVLTAGLAVLAAVAAASGDPEPAPETGSAPSSAPVEAPAPSLDGVDLAVQRVLYASGRAEVVDPVQIPDLPPEVARVLISYGVTLTVPAPEGQG